jgi:hypothetical protein
MTSSNLLLAWLQNEQRMRDTLTERGPGRPTSDPALEHIHLRVNSARKAAYLRAAEPAKLSEWIFAHLDHASGYTPPS